ncbi:class I mannose-6-phosphate isomerase [Mucilaginibacter litoreus]|uniref:Class I mannose-6-phosphate isomerase n=1 Tax=Mucilaginibacter litoreus TaxID=1048221 RepID=A0ABW3AS11_9SPHI
MNDIADTNWRMSKQPLMPQRLAGKTLNTYDLYPTHKIGSGKIYSGYSTLASWIHKQGFVAIDGYAGVFWNDVKNQLAQEFNNANLSVRWISTDDFIKSQVEIEKIVAPYIGTPNSVWGTRAQLTLSDFYNFESIIYPDDNYDLTIILGVGAAELAPKAHLVYLDLPKNELQLRMRAGVINNLGAVSANNSSEMYKRFYFVDWVVLNNHKKQILNNIEIIGDAQWKDTLNWMQGSDLKNALHHIGTTVFRVRPWFEPGAWGGQWMKQHIAGLNPDEVNYAWSFELIVPENGVVFESDSNLLEVSFDFLMFQERDAVLGDFAERFGDEFPIRFDFLDTWDGGNLSIQCHPTLKYIQEHFGETITQDETYYILDCQPEANVYLGFQENIDAADFKKVLEDSRDNGKEIQITEYVQLHQANKHDLFLIPNGTVHSAGAGNLVLEISATPYIFTFKMYDWLRLDLNGKPRAINIDHAFNNLNFERKGGRVNQELISKQQSIQKGEDWEIVHVPTHADHFYDVHRLEFDSEVKVETAGSCHVLMLVEGTSVIIQTANGTENTYHYAETFVVPAAAQSYTLINKGAGKAKVVKAFLKP